MQAGATFKQGKKRQKQIPRRYAPRDDTEGHGLRHEPTFGYEGSGPEKTKADPSGSCPRDDTKGQEARKRLPG